MFDLESSGCGKVHCIHTGADWCHEHRTPWRTRSTSKLQPAAPAPDGRLGWFRLIAGGDE
jgi:hypothetical protein